MSLFNKNVAIEFTQNFTSPVLGNVWIGRKADVRKDLAQKFIANGQAKLQGSEEPAKAGDNNVKIVMQPKLTAEEQDAQTSKEREARINVLLDKTDLTDAEKAELTALESEAFEADNAKAKAAKGKGKRK